jgi:metacaspase-1
MTTRRSLHIGLNFVDPKQYGGWDGALNGCVNDATAMRGVAVSRGFEPQMLLDGDATTEALRSHLDAAAAELDEDDFLFLTYSGHGGQVPDQSGDEPDGYDETWCLYDSQLVDDALYGALCTFARGVRIFIMSDSCHSETVSRAPVILSRDQRREEMVQGPSPSAKQAPREITVAEFNANQVAYTAQAKWWERRSMPPDTPAKVVLISGCSDDETSADGPVNGAFTEAFLQVWGAGNYRKDYSDLRDDVVSAISSVSDQTPGIFSYGVNVAQMKRQIPLTDKDA